MNGPPARSEAAHSNTHFSRSPGSLQTKLKYSLGSAHVEPNFPNCLTQHFIRAVTHDNEHADGNVLEAT